MLACPVGLQSSQHHWAVGHNNHGGWPARPPNCGPASWQPGAAELPHCQPCTCSPLLAKCCSSLSLALAAAPLPAPAHRRGSVLEVQKVLKRDHAQHLDKYLVGGTPRWKKAVGVSGQGGGLWGGGDGVAGWQAACVLRSAGPPALSQVLLLQLQIDMTHPPGCSLVPQEVLKAERGKQFMQCGKTDGGKLIWCVKTT